VDAPRFPTTLGELDDWSVYADFLMTRGDGRGELIAHELALGEPIDPAAVQAFHELARPLCRQGRTATFGFCLGHIRTIAVGWGWRPLRHLLGPDAGTLARIRDVLRTPIASRLEELKLPMREGENPWHLRQLLGAVPLPCRRVELRIAGPWSTAALEDVIGLVPPHVRELAVAGEWPPHWGPALGAAVRDRFDVVALTCGSAWRHFELASPAAAVTATSHVRLRLDEWIEALAGDRTVVGAPGAAALVHTGRRRAIAIPRWPLILLQSHYGLVPVRTQLARSLAEGLAVTQGFEDLATSPARAGAYLMRRGDRWTVRDPDQPPRPVQLGDHLAVGDGGWRLVTAETATALLRGPDLHGASDQ
jgi:hypothetical protein